MIISNQIADTDALSIMLPLLGAVTVAGALISFAVSLCIALG